MKLFDDHVETWFLEDCSRSLFYPPNDAMFRTFAMCAGYGSDYFAYGVEHEVLHAFVAEVRGLAHSWSVWSDAHGTAKDGREWSQRVKDEEHLVVSLQRYLHLGFEDRYGKLREAFPQLETVALRARRLLESGGCSDAELFV